MIAVLLELATEFLIFGLVSYGGGLAILSLLQDRVVELHWLTNAQFVDMIAISQSTPGPIAINLATFVGYFQAGVLGSLLASISVVIPGTLLSIAVAKFMDHFDEKPMVKAMLKGLRSVVIGLIATAILNIALVTIVNYEAFKLSGDLVDLWEMRSIAFFTVMTFLSIKFKKYTLYLIIFSGIMGMLIW